MYKKSKLLILLPNWNCQSIFATEMVRMSSDFWVQNKCFTKLAEVETTSIYSSNINFLTYASKTENHIIEKL